MCTANIFQDRNLKDLSVIDIWHSDSIKYRAELINLLHLMSQQQQDRIQQCSTAGNKKILHVQAAFSAECKGNK